MRFLIITAAVACAVATPSSAQDYPEVSPFAGPRVEGRVGLDRPVVTVSVDDEEESSGKSGVAYGGELGFDAVLHGALIGAYAGIEGSSVESCAEVTFRDEACLRAGRNLTAGARLGVPLHVGTSMFYVKGGYSNGRVRATYEDFDDASNNDRAGANIDGYHLGAGIEAVFNRRFYGRVEYVYTDYDTGRIDEGDLGFDANLERHQALVGVGVRF